MALTELAHKGGDLARDLPVVREKWLMESKSDDLWPLVTAVVKKKGVCGRGVGNAATGRVKECM